MCFFFFSNDFLCFLFLASGGTAVFDFQQLFFMEIAEVSSVFSKIRGNSWRDLIGAFCE